MPNPHRPPSAASFVALSLTAMAMVLLIGVVSLMLGTVIMPHAAVAWIFVVIAAVAALCAAAVPVIVYWGFRPLRHVPYLAPRLPHHGQQERDAPR